MKKLLLHLAYIVFDIFKRAHQAYIYQNYRDRYEIASSFRFNGEGIKFYGDGRIITGEDSYIGSLSTIQAGDGCVVRVGKGCAISHNVRIYTSSNLTDQDFGGKRAHKSKSVNIGNYVWIGVNVFITPGTNIGDNSVVGANSVVTHDVKPYAIVGGVPAKMIRFKDIGNVAKE